MYVQWVWEEVANSTYLVDPPISVHGLFTTISNSHWKRPFFGELPTVNQADFHHEARMTPSSVPQLQAHSGNFAARKMKRTFRSPLGKPECLLHRATLPHRCLRSSLACWDITSKASCPHWQQWLAHSCHDGQIQEKTLRCLHRRGVDVAAIHCQVYGGGAIGEFQLRISTCKEQKPRSLKLMFT